MDFRHGGFMMPLAPEERSKLVAVKALNVLRQYGTLTEVRKAHRTVASQLEDGGVFLEGFSDLVGDVVVCRVLRRPCSGSEPFEQEAMLFALNLRRQARDGGLTLRLVAENLAEVPHNGADAFLEEFLLLWEAAVDASRSDLPKPG